MDDLTQITQLVVRERQGRVRGLEAELRDCFHQDATLTTAWLRFSLSSSSGTILNRVGPPLIHHSGQRAFVELPSTSIRWITVSGVEAELTSFMRLFYRVERRDGAWRISHLTAVPECDTLHPAVPGTDLHVDARAVAGLRHSYRWLAYARSLEGEPLSPDLPGTDRADAMDALYEDAFGWLQAGSVA
jgi:hypothetical protein